MLNTQVPHSTAVSHDGDALYGLYIALPTCKFFFMDVVINMITGMYGLSESVKCLYSGLYLAWEHRNLLSSVT
jgi:hypothetical protein